MESELDQNTSSARVDTTTSKFRSIYEQWKDQLDVKLLDDKGKSDAEWICNIRDVAFALAVLIGNHKKKLQDESLKLSLTSTDDDLSSAKDYITLEENYKSCIEMSACMDMILMINGSSVLEYSC